MWGINKNFPGIKALQSVDFTLRKNEIHALMGESGAGKSTLIKILTSVEEFETGVIRMGGSHNTTINRSSQETQENGISTACQEVNLRPNLSVTENLHIGREPKEDLMVDWRMVRKDTRKLLEGLDVHIDVTMTVENYSITIQQVIVIAKAIDMSTKVLILDELTPSLDNGKVEKLSVLMRQLKARGVGITFATHFLEQVYVVCDRITVPRNDTLAGELRMEELPRVRLMAKIMGKDFDDLAIIKKEGMSMVEEDVTISARELGCKGTIKPFSLGIHKSEIVGLVGLLGPGYSELVRAMYGAGKPDSGGLIVRGEELKVNAPIDAMMEDMVYLPEDRKEGGIITDLPIRENIIIALQAKKGMSKLMSRKEQEEFTDKHIDILQTGIADRETPIKQLSGGNQQKAILGRWLLTNPDFLILDELTRGIGTDIEAEIQRPVLRLAEGGMAVVFVSSGIEKIFCTCSRTTVMCNGEKAGGLKEDELSQDSIIRTTVGGGEE